jgi:hypothetical protein
MPVYLVMGRDFQNNPVFKRVVYAKNRNDSVGIALHEENKERSFENRLLRSKMYYSIRTLVDFVLELDSTEFEPKPEEPEEPGTQKELEP